MDGRALVLAAVLVIVLALLARGTRRGGGSTAGHYDPNAIGRYTIDPITKLSRYELPTLPPNGSAAPTGGPPHRRRRRRRPDDETHR